MVSTILLYNLYTSRKPAAVLLLSWETIHFILSPGHTPGIVLLIHLVPDPTLFLQPITKLRLYLRNLPHYSLNSVHSNASTLPHNPNPPPSPLITNNSSLTTTHQLFCFVRRYEKCEISSTVFFLHQTIQHDTPIIIASFLSRSLIITSECWLIHK